MADILKKFWFVILVSAIFLGVIGVFINDKVSSVFKGKTVNGNDVLLEVNGIDFTADEYYEKYFYGEDSMVSFLSMLLQKEIANQTVTLTSEEIETYEAEAQTQIDYYVSYGYTEDLMNSSAKSLGYSDFIEYYVGLKKVDRIVRLYIQEHIDELFPEFQETRSPRTVSHILIAMEDPENPTADEKSRMEAVDAALASGKSFGDVAYELSEDETSRVNDGLIGYIDNEDEDYVEEFRNAALALNAGETSVWVKTTYGYHLIHCDGTDFESMKDEDGLYTNIVSYYSDENLSASAMLEKLDTLTVTFADDTMLDKIKAYWIGDDE